MLVTSFFFFFQAEDGIRDLIVTGVQTCALPIFAGQRGGVVGDAMAVQTGGVGADLRPEGAAEEPGDRLAERLTLEVPERDVDRRDGRDRPALSPLDAARGVQVLPEHGVLECGLFDEARGV